MIENAQRMIEVGNDMVEANPHFAELSDHVLKTNGYNIPRYGYLRDATSGKLGWEDWSNYWQKPVFASQQAIASTLGADEAYYCIKVVPVDKYKSWEGVLDKGNPTSASQPQQGSIKYTGAAGAYIDITNPSGTITRFTLSAGTFDTDIVAGSYITTTGYATTGNNVSNSLITNVDASNTYIDIDYGAFAGAESSVDATTLTASVTLRWTIPLHPQTRTTGHVGTATTVTETADTLITDSNATFGGDELVGQTVENIETGLSYTIASNTLNTFTITGETSIFSTDDRYNIVTTECNARNIYVSKSTTAAGALSAVFYRQAIVDDNTTTTWDLSAYVPLTAIASEEQYFPPNASFCHSAFNCIWLCGGIEESSGTVSYIEGLAQGEVASYSTPSLVLDAGIISADDEFNGYTIRNMTNGNTDVVSDTDLATNTLTLTTGGAGWAAVDDDIVIYESRTSTASANEGITVSLIDDDYTDAGTAKIARYTLGSALSDWSKIYVGSYVTITGSNESGNDVTAARVLRVGTKYIEILNNDMVAETDTTGMKIEAAVNVYEGTSTLFADGMVGANIEIADDSNYTVSWVDTINQRIGISTLHTVPLALLTGATYKVFSDIELYKSDAFNPKVYQSTSVIKIQDDKVALSDWAQYIIVFCKSSVWRVSYRNLSEAPVLISNTVGCEAPYSIVKTERGIIFFDGSAYSITDGVNAYPVAAYRADNYLSNINHDLVNNIRGVYNTAERRVEQAEPFFDEAINAYGQDITVDSQNVHPSSRMDVNALWMERDSDNQLRIYHGTSGRLTASGKGEIWEHGSDYYTDGLPDDTDFQYTVTAIGSGNITVQGNALDMVIADAEGVPALVLTASSNQDYIPFVVKEAALADGAVSPKKYTISYDDDFDLTDVAVGDIMLLGLIPFAYGPKWDDGGSPHTPKHIREIQIDVEPSVGIVYVDHLINLDPTIKKTTAHYITKKDDKIISEVNYQKCYTYAYRIRGYSYQKIKITSVTPLWDPNI